MNWLDRIAGAVRGDSAEEAMEVRVVAGFRIELQNTREDVSSERVFERARAILDRVRQYQPARFAHLQRDLRAIQVRRYPCRAAYLPATRTCLLELTFMANEAFSDSQVAASLVHEGMHARLDRLGHRFGITPYEQDPARHERICRRAEVHLGLSVPDGGPVLERALGTLALEDGEVAPSIDWEEAQRRVAAADQRGGAGT